MSRISSTKDKFGVILFRWHNIAQYDKMTNILTRNLCIFVHVKTHFPFPSADILKITKSGVLTNWMLLDKYKNSLSLCSVVIKLPFVVRVQGILMTFAWQSNLPNCLQTSHQFCRYWSWNAKLPTYAPIAGWGKYLVGVIVTMYPKKGIKREGIEWWNIEFFRSLCMLHFSNDFKLRDIFWRLCKHLGYFPSLVVFLDEGIHIYVVINNSDIYHAEFTEC